MVGPRTWAGLDDVLARAVERGEPPFVLVLDSLEDPQNVGTLLRSAEAAGVHGVIFPTHRQAPLTPAAIKASAGAVEHLLLCPVDDLPGVLSDLRIRGLRVAAAEADAPLTTAQADLRGPLAIIVGSEGQGLSPVVRRRADVAVRIPMRGAIGSLNAAVAGSILLFAAVAQREPDGAGTSGRPPAPTFDEIAATTAARSPGTGRTPMPTDDESRSSEPDDDATTSVPVDTEPVAGAGIPTSAEPAAKARRSRTPAPTTAAQKRSRTTRPATKAAALAIEPESDDRPAAAHPGDPTDPDPADIAVDPRPEPAGGVVARKRGRTSRAKPVVASGIDTDPATDDPATDDPATDDPRTGDPATGDPATDAAGAAADPHRPSPRARRPKATADAEPTPPTRVPGAAESVAPEPVADDLLPGGPDPT